MSEEEKKNKKKKAAIIAGIIGASTLIGGGGIAAATIGITEAETKVEENEREEEEKKKKTRSGKKTTNTEPVHNKQDLSTGITTTDLGIIATNGKPLTVEMIKDKLPANIQNEVNISIQGNKAILTAKTGVNANYKGNVVVTYTLDTKQDLSTVITTTDLGIIATNGKDLTVEMIKDKLPANIRDEVNISIQGNKAIVTLKANSSKYKGNPITAQFKVDKSVELSTAFTDLNLGIIATNGKDLTVEMIKDKLPANIQNEIDIKIQQGNKAILTAKTGVNANYKGNVVVTYTLDTKQDLSTVITTTDLGIIATNGKDLTVEMIKDKLPANIRDEVNISIQGNKAIVTLKANSSKYKGNPITAQFKVDKSVELSTAFTDLNLGIIATNGKPLTVEMIKDKLRANIQNEIDIKIQQGNKAILTAKTGVNANYKGNVVVTYTLDTKQDLSTVITTTDLGIIATNGKDLTVEMIKDKLPANIRDEVNISIQGNKAIVTLKANSSKYKGNPITAQFKVDKSVELSTAFTDLNLGIIATNGKPLTVEMIKDKLRANIQNEIDIKIQQGNKAILTAKTGVNANYKGNVVVTYTLDTKQDLSTVITTTDLGIIATNGKDLTVEMIKDKLPANIRDEVNISIQGNKAIVTLKANSSKYKGNPITAQFKVDKSVELSTAFTDLNLGIIATNGKDLTVEMIKDKLPANIRDEVNISIQGNKAIVTLKANSSKYKGNPITAQFKVDKSVELSTAFTDLNLGIIATNGKDLTVEMIKDKLPANIQNEIDIKIQQGNKAILTAKTGVNANYKGNVVVTYTLDTKQDLSTVITTTDLGIIATNGKDLTVEMIKDKLPANIRDEVNISIQGNKAIVTLKANSSKYKGNPITAQFKVDKSVELSTAFTDLNLGIIATNGKDLTVEMIKDKLRANIQNEIDIKIQQGNKAILTAKTGVNANYKGNVVVTYTLDTKQDLSTVITTTDLGIIATNGKDLTVEMIKDKLPANIRDEVNISIQGNKAIVTLKANSSKYKGNPITAQFKVDKSVELSTAFTDLNLGIIATNGKDLTVEMIKDKLPANIQNEIDIKIQQGNKAILTAKTGVNANYKGNVVVTYTLDTKQDLSTVITTTDLGIIATNGKDLTVEMIKDKLPANIRDEVNISIQGNKAIVTLKANSSKYKGNPITAQFKVDKSVELSTAFTDLNLGIIATNGKDLTVEMIKDKLPANIRDEVNISIQGNKAIVTLKANSSKYKGNPITAQFKVDKSVELSTAFTDLNLGIIATNGKDLTVEMIKDKLKNKIKDSKKTNINSINFIEIKNESAKIEYKWKSVYKGTMKINYTVDKSVELSTAFTDLNLGIIATNGKDLTVEMIKDKLPANIRDEVNISIQGNKAIVTIKANSSKYKGNPITAQFKVDKSVELSTAFTDLNLGIIATNGKDLTVEMIKDKLKNKIKDSKKTNINSINFIEIKNESAKIEYKWKSVYKGTMKINYTVDKSVELSTAFTDLNLGIIATNGKDLTVEMIKDKLPANIRDEVNISIQGNKAIVTIKANSSKYKGNPITAQFKVDKSVELSTAFTDLNLGIIATNGKDLTVEMIKDKLKNKIKDSKKTNINSINFIEIKNESAKIEYKWKSVYKGTMKINYTVDKSVELSTAFTDLNLGIIATNGKDLTVEMIKDKLPANIQNEIDIKIQKDNKATLFAKASSNYKGNVEVNYTVDNKIELFK